MIKRKFLVISSLFFVLIAFACVSNKNKNKNDHACMQKEIYIQLYSVRADIKTDFKGTIAKIAEMGYTGIEAAGYADGKFYDLSPESFKNEIGSVGMKVLSSHVNKRLDDKIASTNMDEIWQWWDVAIQAHQAAGMQYLVVPSMPKLKTLADLKLYCDYFNQIGEKCNAAGLRFGYHNHDFEFAQVEGQVMYDYMLQNTDPDKVFFQMDVYWVVKGGQSPVDYFNNYPGRFEVLHIKDNKELGQSGMVGFDAIFQNTKQAGVKYLVVEVEKYNYTPLESVKMSLDYLLQNQYVKASYAK